MSAGRRGHLAGWEVVSSPIAAPPPRLSDRLRSEKANCEAGGRGFDSRHLHELRGVHETGYLVFMKPFVGGGDESTDSNATPKTTTAGPRGRQFRVDLDLDGARHGAETH